MSRVFVDEHQKGLREWYKYLEVPATGRYLSPHQLQTSQLLCNGLTMLSTLLTLALAATATAAPGSSPLSERQTAAVCTSGYSAQCCATDVLNLAALDCENGMLLMLTCNNETERLMGSTVPVTPTSKEDFTAQCSTEGQQALCCLLPIVSHAPSSKEADIADCL